MEALAPPPRGFLPALLSLVTPPRFTARAPSREGVRYRTSAARGVAPLADVYLPEAKGPLPSVILVHGGGFVIGTRRMKPMRFLATRLAEAGFAVASIDYRMVFRGGRLDESLEDLAAASEWWRASAVEHGLDPQRVSILGLSAGATLSLLHAGRAAPGNLHRVVSVFGVTDFAAVGGLLGKLLRRMLLRSGAPSEWAARSPLAACRTASPVLVVHGEADAMVPIEHAHRLVDMRRRAGLPVESLLLPGQPHAFLNDATNPAAQRTVEETIRFLRG